MTQMTSKRILFITATRPETQAVRSVMSEGASRYSSNRLRTSQIMGKTVISARCGVGPEAACSNTSHLIAITKPDQIIVSGTAGSGGLAKPGQVIVAERFCRLHNDLSKSEDITLPQKTAEILASSLSPCFHAEIGSFITVDEPVFNRDVDSSTGKSEKPLLCYEMETWEIAAIAVAHNIPIIAARVISDMARKADRFLYPLHELCSLPSISMLAAELIRFA